MQGVTQAMKGSVRYEKLFNSDKVFQDEEDQSDIDSTLGQDVGRQPTFSPREYQQMEFESPSIVVQGSQSIYRHIRKFSKQLPSRTCRFPSLVAISIFTLLLLGGLLLAIILHSIQTTSNSATASLSTNCKANSNWSGFRSVSHAFAFGDSWTSTSFDFNGPQPTLSEPLGNPPFPGITTSNSTNWIGYLTTKYNQSKLLTYNLAVAGTTLDNKITPAYPYCVTESIYLRYMPAYAEGSKILWKPSSTLFVMFIGINDVIVLQLTTEAAALAELDRKLEASHYKALSSLYGTGARNFLLMKVPPLERVWQPPTVGPQVKKRFKIDVAEYNKRIERVAGRFKADYEDANVWIFDTNKLFIHALDNPQAYTQLRNIVNTTSYCPSYALGTSTPDYFDPVCGVAVNRYFWLDPLHPTYPMHDVLAEHVTKELVRGPNVC